MNTTYEEYAFASTKCFDRDEKRDILSVYNEPFTFIDTSDTDIMKLDIVGKEELKSFREEMESVRKNEEYDWYFCNGYGLTYYYDADFPEQLLHISNPPVALFFSGSLPEKREKLVAMVGARRCTEYGRIMSEQTASELAKGEFSIVSGMAYGVDGAAHRGALRAGGRTYAFLGCGIDVCYPQANNDIYQEIPHHGAIVSEFPPGMQPTKQSFPDRNRLISGLSQAVLVMEARERSGSLITADLALDQGKDVYALPGRITDPLSAGTNRLIWQGAGIIRSPEAITAQLKMEDASFTMKDFDEELTRLNLEKDEMVVYSCFDLSAKSIDEVQAECNMTLLQIINIVMSLCRKGYLKEVFMNHYVRNVGGSDR